MRAFLAALILAHVFPVQGHAQGISSARSSVVAREELNRLVDSLASLMESNYVDADTARLIAEGLRKRLRAGAYPVHMPPAQLAERLSADLKAVNGDLHLYVEYHAPRAAEYLSVRLLTSRRFSEAYRVVDPAMAFLQRTDAMILDLQTTPGGDTAMPDYVASYFLPDSTRTLTSTAGRADNPDLRWTRKVAGGKRLDIPLGVYIRGPYL